MRPMAAQEYYRLFIRIYVALVQRVVTFHCRRAKDILVAY